ncbi:uncharacterized protein PG998_005115 [Apiospora kogelbergensis]|uniref:Uncharacterized protein n=1 Tax=Apiospora kogelbergensis TaxID=1337665 RepID=A0AAW0Q7Y3_9PEZI
MSSASAQAIAISPPAIPASGQSSLLPVPTQVQILAAFLAALGSGWVALAALFAYHFRKHAVEDDMAQRIAHRLAATPTSELRGPVDDIIVLEEIGFFNRHKEDA